MRWHHVRAVVNAVNGSTLAGLGVALAGHARLARAPDGVIAGTGYRLPVPPAPAFTLGNVILTRRSVFPPDSALFRHEARHATQYAWCGGLLMLPMYFTAAGVSWVLCGDFGAWNIFERRAGLADGGYAASPLRPSLTRPPCSFRMHSMAHRLRSMALDVTPGTFGRASMSHPLRFPGGRADVSHEPP